MQKSATTNKRLHLLTVPTLLIEFEVGNSSLSAHSSRLSDSNPICNKATEKGNMRQMRKLGFYLREREREIEREDISRSNKTCSNYST